MARLLGPDPSSRTIVQTIGSTSYEFSGRLATVYTDEAATVLADIAAYQSGSPTVPGASITSSAVRLDGQSRLPRFWFPDSVDTLYVRVVGLADVRQIDADQDARLDQGGTGNTTVVNVRDYGAKGDGTDDTAAIASASAALPAAGGVLLFPVPASYYSVNAGLTLNAKSKVTIRGAAPGVEIRYAAATADTQYNAWPDFGKDSIFRLLDCSDVLIEDLKLNGNISNRTAHASTESFNSCVLVAGSTRVTVRNCVLTEATTDGVTVMYNQGGTLSSDVTVTGCTISKGRRNNVSLVGQDGCVISHCRLLDAGTVQGVSPQAAIDVEPDNSTGRSKNVRIVNNVVTGSAGTYAITCAGTGTQNLTISGNHVYDNAGNGINLSIGASGTNSQATVTGNTAANVAAIRVTGTACDLISGNTIAGNSYGVNGPTGVDGLLITGNKFTGNTYNAVQMTNFVKVVCNDNLFLDNTSSAGDTAGAGFAWRGTPATANAIAVFNDNLLFTTAGASPLMSGARVDGTCNAIARGNLAKNVKTGSTVARGFADFGSFSVDSPVPQVPAANYLVASRYTAPTSGSRTTLQLAADTEYAMPFYVAQGTARGIDRIGIEVTIAGTAGTLIRLGVRATGGDSLPGSVTLDAGTVAGDAIASVEATVSLADLSPGLYWLTAAAQSTGGTLPTVRAVAGNMAPISVTALATALGNVNLTGYSSTATVSGALPGTYPLNSRVGAAPLIAVRGA